MCCSQAVSRSRQRVRFTNRMISGVMNHRLAIGFLGLTGRKVQVAKSQDKRESYKRKVQCEVQIVPHIVKIAT